MEYNMTNTLQTYQKQQSLSLMLLEKLDRFIEKGNQFGLNLSQDLKKKLNNTIHSVKDDNKLKIVLVGGFSEGKTSIAAAWLGKIDPKTMNISAAESSNEVRVYEIDDDYVLIDTPGLYGYKEQENLDSHQIEKYKDTTKKYVSEAHIILYVMNSKNPIKESHRSDLHWLFRELNLLPRTIFVLSRFDEVADVEDENDYQHNLSIKRQNVRERLRDFLSLNKQEEDTLSIVGVSANPFDEGVEYWLKNRDEFEVLSHISTLQDATNHVVKYNGGYNKIIEETRKSIFSDILLKEIPLIEEKNNNLDIEFRKITDICEIQDGDLALLNKKIIIAKEGLKISFSRFFADIILQAQGASLETIEEFLIREIGEEGCLISTNIQHIFERETNQITTALNTQIINFNAELNSIDSAFETMTKQGLNHLVKNVKLNSSSVLAARDGLVAGGKLLGVNLSQTLKFKPWGAIKFANKLNGAFAALGIAMEAWDSWQQAKRQEEFNKARQNLVRNLQEQQKELLNLIDGNDFIPKFFPHYDEVKEKIIEIRKIKEESENQRKSFNEWKKEADIIEAEFREIS